MAKKRYAQDELLGPAPKPEGLLTKAANIGLSGLATVGNTLDLIPSMARDVVGGISTGNWSKYNPVDQLVTPFTSENRHDTREILRDNGLVGKKDTWGNWAAGTAGDILLDPLLPFNFGARAIGGAGNLVKSAGVFDDIGRIASLKAGKIGSVGSREARTTLRLGDIATHAPDQFQKIKATALNQGLDITKMMDEPLGGLAKNWMTGTVYGSGKAPSTVVKNIPSPVGNTTMTSKMPGDLAWKIANGMDTAADTLRHAKIPGTDIQPIGDTINLFSKRSGGGRSRAQVQAAGQHFDEMERVSAKHGVAIGKMATDLKKMGHTNDDMDQVRKWVELPNTAPTAYQPVVKEARDLMDTQPARASKIGYSLGDSAEKAGAAGSDALYSPRHMTSGLESRGVGQAGGFAPDTPAGHARWDWTHGSKGGTEALKEMGPFTKQFLEANPTATVDQLAAALKQNFSHNLPDEFLTNDQFQALKGTKKYRDNPTIATVQQLIADKTAKKYAGQNVPFAQMKPAKAKVGGVVLTPQNTWKKAAEDLKSLSPELLESGIWGNHLLTDMAHSGALTEQAIRSRELALDHLSQLKGDWKPVGTPGTVPVSKVLKDLGLKLGNNKEGALKSMMERLGKNLTGMKPKDWDILARHHINKAVPADTARFLTESVKGFDGPESVTGLLNIYDSWNRVVKSIFTSARPGFHGRNTPSGWANNAMAEQFSAKSIKAGWDVASGNPIEGASKIPLIQQIAQQRGIQNLDDKSATEIVSQLYYGHDIGGHKGTAISNGGEQLGGSINDILGEIPGQVPVKASNVLKSLAGGKAAGTSWNPMKWGVNGAFGAKNTTVPFVKAGEQVGQFGEHMNRFPAFYALLEQGVDPGEAAKRVREAQVGYQGKYYTKFEQQVMSRLFLFYKYFKGMAPFTLKQLIEQPSGPLSQALKGLNRARSPEDLTPEWISDTTSIPLGQQPDGSQRYFTGLGMSFEDPIQFATPSAQNFGLEAISRLNPILKAPLEYAFGQSTFQKGGVHGGGRPLEDLDPLLGRTLSNIGNMTGLTDSKAPVKYPGSSLIEHALSNSPLGVPLTMLRTATDTRKSPVAKATNLLTGLKITDISPASQDRELQRRIQQVERSLGAKSFNTTYLPQDVKDEMSPKEKQEAAKLAALKKLLTERSKSRKK